jgi:hypothetical protein
MKTLEKSRVDTKNIYLFVNCHGDSMVHSSFRFSTQIFPTQERKPTDTEPGSEIIPAKPIFFNYE